MRAIMEEMVPELEDLEKRGYFTKSEIRQIVKKRTDFEYRLKRRAAVKADYLRYSQDPCDCRIALSTKVTFAQSAVLLTCCVGSTFSIPSIDSGGLIMYRYVQYESRLDELRKLRKEAMGLEGKRGLADNGMTRRIHFIYQRATQKFRGDLRLWSSWLQFCKDTNSTRKLSQVCCSDMLHRSSLAPSEHIPNDQMNTEQDRHDMSLCMSIPQV